VATFDLNILPIYRKNGQGFADLPGLLAATPPRKPARGRDKDSLVLYLMLSGNAEFSNAEMKLLLGTAAGLFYQTAGSLTSAMRKTVENINTALLERNLSTTSRGQYALGLLVIVVVRENTCTISLTGPAHVVWVGDGQQRHIYDPALSGKGLGTGQGVRSYLSQVEFRSNDLIALCGKFPKDWEADLVNSRPPATLDASYRKLTYTKGDLHAALIQPKTGQGMITILKPDVSALRVSQPPIDTAHKNPVSTTEETVEPEETLMQNDDKVAHIDSSDPEFATDLAMGESEFSPEEPQITDEELDVLADFGAHMVQPSAYAIPIQPEVNYPNEDKPAVASSPTGPHSFPPSIPRATHGEPEVDINLEEDLDNDEVDESQTEDEVTTTSLKADKPSAHAEAARQMAKVMSSGIKSGRRLNERAGNFLRNFIPKLLPGSDSRKPLVIPTYVMLSMALIIPVLVAVVSWVIYDKYGLNERYNELYQLALAASSQASSETDPGRQRDAYNKVLENLDQAEQYRETDNTKLLRADTQAKLDNLMGIIRLEFIPAFTNGLGNSTEISRMAANESDLYMLDAERGDVLHAAFTGRSLELDGAFNCQPGTYGGYQVGTIVDILALPKVNAVGASVLGIDTAGNLLYCSPGQVPQVFPLPPLPNINWGRITSFVLDNDRLYILDSETRAVWVYNGRDSTFLDPPYFFFSNQIPQIENAIDLAVSSDDLYLLHTDGRISTCTFSRIAEVPTRCVDPAPRIDNFPAHQDIDIFAQAHFTQISLTNPPNPVILLLDSVNQSVFRFTPRSLELQNQISGFAGKASPFQQRSIGAIAISPNYVLYLAVGNQVYFATNLP
jgi:hypothetical protein